MILSVPFCSDSSYCLFLKLASVEDEVQSLRFLLGLPQRAAQLKLRLVPPPSRPHFLSPALRTRHFSTFPFPSSGSGPGKFHKGLVSAVDSFSRAICSCRPLCWCCAGERLEKGSRVRHVLTLGMQVRNHSGTPLGNAQQHY